MDRLIVACVQQRIRLPAGPEEYRADAQRFLRAAQNKHARLVVFPELAGLMVALPMLADFRSNLLKQADAGRRRNASLWKKSWGAVAAGLAGMMNADLRKSLAGLVDVSPQSVWDAYADFFGSLAREFGMTIIAPSAYLPDPLDGVIRNMAAVFGPDGSLLGTQAKVMLHPEDEDIARAGSTWDVIQTDVGRIGLIVGSDVLYPEVGRLLAYQGAEILVGMGACPNLVLYNKLRSGMLARMQDNQLFGLISFLVGPNQLGHRSREPFVGKSAIFAPQELTPRFSGVLVEMGNVRSEGVLTAEWDFVALRQLWETSDTPIRQNLPLSKVSQVLAKLYDHLQSQPRLTASEHLAVEPGHESMVTSYNHAQRPERTLEDLTIFASVTSRWPPADHLFDDEMAEWFDDDPDAAMLEEQTPPPPPINQGTSRSPIRTDDETDEMDALPPPK